MPRRRETRENRAKLAKYSEYANHPWLYFFIFFANTDFCLSDVLNLQRNSRFYWIHALMRMTN